MERYHTDLTLTSTETAGLLRVHPSTVKRWCNSGELPFDTTQGGHRRIHLDDAVSFAQHQGIRTVLSPFHPFEPHVWTALKQVEEVGSYQRLHSLAMGWVLRGEVRRLEHLYVALGRSPAVSFCDFCDQGIRGLMRLVGTAWQEGRVRVGEEHMVSQVMAEVLLRLRHDWFEERHDPYANGASRVAVVGSLEGNQHHLGSQCIRVLLERSGWKVNYLGPDVPIEEFGLVQKGRGAELVCVSLPPSGTLGDVIRSVSVLREFYDLSRPYTLLFGGASLAEPGEGVLEGPFEAVRIIESCVALNESLASTPADSREA